MVCDLWERKKNIMTYFQKSGNKYRAKSTEYNGVIYHSKLEASYAQELDLRIKAKDIKSWERQVKLDLRINDVHITNYYMDFVITHNNGEKEYVECKGMELPLWKLKWSILEATFDEQFREHPDDSLTIIKQSSMRFR